MTNKKLIKKCQAGDNFNRNWKPSTNTQDVHQQLRERNVNYAKAWYDARSKHAKYANQLKDIDKIHQLLDQSVNAYVSPEQRRAIYGNVQFVTTGNLPAGGGFMPANQSKTGQAFWFGNKRGGAWHEGIGHWIGDQIPSVLRTSPTGTFMYSRENSIIDDATAFSIDEHINENNENHADTWEFRGLNLNMRDDNGNLYIHPDRQLTPEDVQDMLDKGAKLPQQWKNTSITPEIISNFHNTFASITPNKMLGLGNQIIGLA